MLFCYIWVWFLAFFATSLAVTVLYRPVEMVTGVPTTEMGANVSKSFFAAVAVQVTIVYAITWYGGSQKMTEISEHYRNHENDRNKKYM